MSNCHRSIYDHFYVMSTYVINRLDPIEELYNMYSEEECHVS